MDIGSDVVLEIELDIGLDVGLEIEVDSGLAIELDVELDVGWMTPLDWAHEIGLNILRKKNIMMKKEFYEWRFKNGYIFVYI